MNRILPSVFPAFAQNCLLLILATLMATLVSSHTFGQSVFIEDLNQRESTDELEFSQLTAGDGKAFVVVRGRELWTSYLASNDQDVSVKLGSYDTITNLTKAGSLIYFTARTSDKGMELYHSDGTPQGTTLVKDIYPGAGDSNPSQLVDVNGILFFSASTSAFGKEVWRSNGTEASTVLVKDVFPKGGSSNPAHLTNVNGVLFFAANDGTNGYELWKSDGTSGGTTLVKDIRTGYKVSSAPDKFESVGSTLYFTATESTTGRELYKSDGTASGTVLVKDIRSGISSSNIDNVTANGSTLIFTANDGLYGDELWKSDGTPAGTVLVKDMTPGGAGSHGEQAGQYKMGNFTSINGIVYYTAYDRNTYMIWRTNGTTAGTIALAPAHGAMYEQPRPNFVGMNGYIYFFNNSWPESWSYTLMKMNADGSNHRYVYDVYIDSESALYTPELIVVQDKNGTNHLYYYGIMVFEGYKLIKSTGAEDYEGTYTVPDPYVPTASSYPHDFKSRGNATYFIANPTWYDNQALWMTDGSSIRELVTFSSDGGEYAFTDNSVYASGKYWLEIYRMNNNIVWQDYIADDYNLPPAINLTGVKSKMFFTNENSELYVVDDASTAVTFLKDFTNLYDFAPVGANLIFRTRNASNGEELWRSNGTPSGTIRYATIAPNFQTESLYRPTATIKTNTHYFVANDGVHGNEIWRTQGTAGSTYMVADLNPNDHLFIQDGKENDIRSMYKFRDSLYVSAVDNTGAWALYKTNGTSAGMRKVLNMNPIVEMVEAGARLYLFAIDSVDSTKLNVYITNGTEATTKFMFQLPTNRYTQAVVLSELYVRPNDGTNLVWRTNGKACGTFSFDLGVEAGSEIINQANTLYFAGRHVDKGVEPYYYDITPFFQPCQNQTTFALSESVEEIIDNEKAVSTYPNPFESEMTLSVMGDGEAKVSVYTPSGSQVEDLGTLQCNTTYSIGSSWPMGIYIVRINNGGKLSAQKVIKKR